MEKWLTILKLLPVMARLHNQKTWREPSTWASVATAILSAGAAYYGLSEAEYEALLAGILGAISSVAGVLLPERGDANKKSGDFLPDSLKNGGFGDK